MSINACVNEPIVRQLFEETSIETKKRASENSAVSEIWRAHIRPFIPLSVAADPNGTALQPFVCSILVEARVLHLSNMFMVIAAFLIFRLRLSVRSAPEPTGVFSAR
jgi:hypothetical protein